MGWFGERTGGSVVLWRRSVFVDIAPIAARSDIGHVTYPRNGYSKYQIIRALSEGSELH